MKITFGVAFALFVLGALFVILVPLLIVWLFK